MDDGLSVCIGQGIPREAFEVEDYGLVLWLFVRANVGNMGGCVYLYLHHLTSGQAYRRVSGPVEIEI